MDGKNQYRKGQFIKRGTPSDLNIEEPDFAKGRDSYDSRGTRKDKYIELKKQKRQSNTTATTTTTMTSTPTKKEIPREPVEEYKIKEPSSRQKRQDSLDELNRRSKSQNAKTKCIKKELEEIKVAIHRILWIMEKKILPYDQKQVSSDEIETSFDKSDTEGGTPDQMLVNSPKQSKCCSII